MNFSISKKKNILKVLMKCNNNNMRLERAINQIKLHNKIYGIIKILSEQVFRIENKFFILSNKIYKT